MINGKDKADFKLKTIGMTSSIVLSVLTVLTFAIAICTPPISGPFATGTITTYPYTDIISRFPRDYFWMYPAMALVLVFIIYGVCVHRYACSEKKLYSHIGVMFAVLASGILFVDYFLQVTVIQQSLLNGETEALALLTQYNPHGIFIALEEAGYLLLSFSILFFAPVFTQKGWLSNTLRWTCVVGFILSIAALGVITFVYGIQREYIFEIAVISIDFIVLIILGILSGILFKRI